MLRRVYRCSIAAMRRPGKKLGTGINPAEKYFPTRSGSLRHIPVELFIISSDDLYPSGRASKGIANRNILWTTRMFDAMFM